MDWCMTMLGWGYTLQEIGAVLGGLGSGLASEICKNPLCKRIFAVAAGGIGSYYAGNYIGCSILCYGIVTPRPLQIFPDDPTWVFCI